MWKKEVLHMLRHLKKVSTASGSEDRLDTT